MHRDEKSREQNSEELTAFLFANLSRRSLLQRAAVLGAGTVTVGALLTACAEDDDEPEDEPAVDPDTDDDVETPDDDDEPVDEPDDEDEATDDEPVTTGGHLFIAASAFPANLEPTHSGNPSLSLLLQMMDGLTRTTEELEVVPLLATDWEILDDISWEFRLRDDVDFHNGEHFDAEAAKFTIERAIDIERGYARRGRIASVSSVDIVDDYTIQVNTEAPFPLLPRGLRDIVIEPPEYVAEVGDQAAGSAPIGTGPFKHVEWLPDDRLILEANQDYFEGPPGVEQVTVRLITEPSTRVASLLSGEVHIAEQLALDLIDQIDADPDVDVVTIPVAMGLVITYDFLTENPTNDLRVRQAIDMAINREALFSSLLREQGAILDGQLITEGSVGYNPDLSPTPYDPERARELLAEAGHEDGLELDLYTPSGRYLIDSDLAIAIAAQLEEVGIQLNLQVLEWGDYSARNQDRTLSPMNLIGWFNVGDSEFAMVWYTTDSGRSYWENPEFDQLFDSARAELDEDERERLFHEANVMMNEELPSSFLFQLPAIYGVSDRVSGWEPRPDEMLYLAGTSVDD